MRAARLKAAMMMYKEQGFSTQFEYEELILLQDTNMVDVEFEWFDPQPEHDFHGLKTLLRQLFDLDSQNLELSELADIILAQPLLGSTVKVDGNETDPYAFLTVINLQEHAVRKGIR